MKPEWHDEEVYGPWTDEDTQDLLEYLTYESTHRSLTKEERAWLETAE